MKNLKVGSKTIEIILYVLDALLSTAEYLLSGKRTRNPIQPNPGRGHRLCAKGGAFGCLLMRIKLRPAA